MNMSLSSLFKFGTVATTSSTELPEIFAMKIKSDEFVDIDVMNIYSKILTDCIDRVQGIPDKVMPLLWDNFLQNEAPQGLISLIAGAMTDMSDLYLVYDEAIALLREATADEEVKIEADYLAKGESDIGIFVSFESYNRTEMVRVYSAMEYAVISSMNKMMNLSKAIQYKMSDMRGSVSLSDSSAAIEQASTLAKALRLGKDIIIDKNDEIVTNIPNIAPIKESITFIDSKLAFYYGMPLSYINGEQTPGIGSTGEADTKAVERGLRNYFISILKPILDDLFDLETSFKSNDFRQIGTAIEAIKAFELVGDDLLSRENKQLIIAKLFDVEFDPESLGPPLPMNNNPRPFRVQPFEQ